MLRIFLCVIFLFGCSKHTSLSSDTVKSPVTPAQITHAPIEKNSPYTFYDEFDSPSHFQQNWQLQYNGYTDHGRLHYYLPTQIRLSNDTLKLKVHKNQYKNFPYRSGAVTTKNTFSQTYGRWEFRAKLPTGQGLFPAIWLLPTNNEAFPEIDIVEMLGQKPNELWQVAHNGVSQISSHLSTQFDGSKWHTYTLDWSIKWLIFYIDGIEQFRTPNISHTPMYIWMNVAVGGVWVGNPDNTTPFPAQMEIDYVRVYK